MKKKIFLVSILSILCVLLFVVSASAATIYKTEAGDQLFTYTETNGDFVFESYEGEFPKVDENGNALTWYITKTETVSGDTVHTVSSKITLDGAGSIDGNGSFTFTSPVTNKNTVSVNYPDNAGIKKIPAFGAYGSRSQNNILFAYLPNTLTELPTSLFQETPVIVGEIDDETPVTVVPYKLCHEARNIKVVNIPAAVTRIESYDDRNGAPFCNTLSLKTVTFAPNSRLTHIQPYAFCGSKIEEIQFPASLISINQNLFRSCTNLKVIRFSENFKYFENVNRAGNVDTNHHSVTHTVTGLKEVYIPASFYATKPDVNYKVSYAFDGGTNVKYFYTGTAEQFAQAKENFKNAEWTTNAQENNYKFLNATVVSYSVYAANPEGYENGNYVICDYNACDAFRKGQHEEDNNPCVINCARCNTQGVAEKNPIHDELVVITYTSYTVAGTRVVDCQNEGCGHYIDGTANPLFVCNGYSIPDDERIGVAVSYKVDKNAVAEYKALNNDFEYGVFAVLESKIGTNDIIKQDGTLTTSSVCANLTGESLTAVTLKIVGFTTESDKALSLAMGIYVKKAEEGQSKYTYIQVASPEEGQKYSFISYNEIL